MSSIVQSVKQVVQSVQQVVTTNKPIKKMVDEPINNKLSSTSQLATVEQNEEKQPISKNVESNEPYKLIFEVFTRKSGKIVDFISYLFFHHPGWFEDVHELSLLTPTLDGMTKREAQAIKEKAFSHHTKFTSEYIFEPAANIEKTQYACFRPSNTCDSFTFQFSKDPSHRVFCKIETKSEFLVLYSSYDLPTLCQHWTLVFTTKDHLDYFSQMFYQFCTKNTIDKKAVSVFTNDSNGWTVRSSDLFPTMDTIFIKKEIKEKIQAKIERIENMKDRAKKFGKPIKMNMLLHGVPGSGKTSLAKAIAQHYKKNLFILSFSPEMKDTDIIKLLKSVNDNSIVLLEDIDSFFVKRDSKCNVTFSCLLNILDGVTNVDKNILTILTANYPENLDSALIRPGRVDMLVKFDYPERNEIFDAFAAYTELDSTKVTNEFNKFYKLIKGISCPMSLITDYLFHHQHDYIECIDELLLHYEALNTIYKNKGDNMYL